MSISNTMHSDHPGNIGNLEHLEQSGQLSSASSPANMRDGADFSRAKRHSILVKLLKVVLPISAATLVIFFAASSILSYVPISDVSVEKVGLNDGKLVMNKPKLSGFDKKNRPYDVKAATAIQDLKKPGLIELKTIDANLPLDATSFARVNAENGTYDSTNEKMVLRNNVTIKGARGMNISMQEALIDMKSGSMVSDKPVIVESGETDISANTLRVEDNGKRIIFKDNVKMIIKRPISRGVKPPPSN